MTRFLLPPMAQEEFVLGVWNGGCATDGERLIAFGRSIRRRQINWICLGSWTTMANSQFSLSGSIDAPIGQPGWCIQKPDSQPPPF